jgi:hypothetical protein
MKINMYVLNQSEQTKILSSCDLISKDSQNWTREYKEKTSGRVWIEYYPYPGMHGDGPVYLKEKEDESDTLCLADKHLSSQREDDWIGFVTDLFPTVDEAEKLVKYLEGKKGKYSKRAIRTLYDRIQINRGSMNGMHYTEIAKQFEQITKLKERIKNLQPVHSLYCLLRRAQSDA